MDDEFISELNEQIEYLNSHPEENILRHSDYISIIVFEQRYHWKERLYTICQTELNTAFARMAYAATGIGVILALIGWSYASSSRKRVTRAQKKAQPTRTKGGKDIKKPK